MDNGYRAITEEEGAFVEAGDQMLPNPKSSWVNIERDFFGDKYTSGDFESGAVIYRRPIAQDHYATPTDKIVEHALDATANATDEWPDSAVRKWDGTGNPPVDVMCNIYDSCMGRWYEGIIDYLSDDFCVWTSSDGQHSQSMCHVKFEAILTPEQAEEREREEAVVEVAEIIMAESGVSDGYANIRAAATRIVELLSTDQLKDKSDD